MTTTVKQRTRPVVIRSNAVDYRYRAKRARPQGTPVNVKRVGNQNARRKVEKSALSFDERMQLIEDIDRAIKGHMVEQRDVLIAKCAMVGNGHKFASLLMEKL